MADDRDADGSMFRSFFADSDDEPEEFQAEPEENEREDTESEGELTCTMVMGVPILEDVKAGIASQLWPAAQHLAHFVLQEVKKASSGGKLEFGTQAPYGAATNEMRSRLHALLRDEGEKSLRVIELGAGVGLTGIKLAREVRSHVVLTDLECALELLDRNIQLTKKDVSINASAKRLAWGNANDAHAVLAGFDGGECDLIIAADCVYWEELHTPLTDTLVTLLSASPTTICLIAGVRRWKRDNTFYQALNKTKKAGEGCLQCVCLSEEVQRKPVSGGVLQEEGTERVVTRIYAVQWIPT